MARPKGIIAGSARCRFNPCFLRKLISYLSRSQHHHHLAAFHLWHGLNRVVSSISSRTRWSTCAPSSWCAISSSAETQSDLHLVTSLDELADILHFDLIVVFINVRTELISLTSTTFCFLRFVGAFLGLILEFTETRILQTGGSTFGWTSTRSRPT